MESLQPQLQRGCSAVLPGRHGPQPQLPSGELHAKAPIWSLNAAAYGHVEMRAETQVLRTLQRALPVTSSRTPREVQGFSLKGAMKVWSPGSPEKGLPWRPALLQAKSWNLSRKGEVSWGGMWGGIGCSGVSRTQREDVPRCVGGRRRWAGYGESTNSDPRSWWGVGACARRALCPVLVATKTSAKTEAQIAL